MATIELRQAGLGDATTIRALTRAAYAKWVPRTGRESKPMMADYDYAVRHHRFDLLYRDGAMVALIETIRQPDHLLIENVAVLPEQQGQGLGRRLLVHAEDLARAQGHAEIRLYTNKLFVENIALYQRLGYRIDREEPNERGIIVHMSKRL